MFIPADAQTNDKSALFWKRYRSASRFGRTGFESQSRIALEITPRHKAAAVVRSGFVANTISLTMMYTPSSARAELPDCRLPIALLRVHWQGQRSRTYRSFPMACEGIDRK